MTRLNWRRVNDEKKIRERGAERLEPTPPSPPRGPQRPLGPPSGYARCPAGCGTNIPVERLASHLRKCAFRTQAPPPAPSNKRPALIKRRDSTPRRFHATVALDPTRVGHDASRIADKVISHLSGLVGAKVKVTLEVEAEIPAGAPDHVVRAVTENSRTLNFTSQRFEKQ
jgi:hypothetical protein